MFRSFQESLHPVDARVDAIENCDPGRHERGVHDHSSPGAGVVNRNTLEGRVGRCCSVCHGGTRIHMVSLVEGDNADDLIELAHKVENRNVALRGVPVCGGGKPPIGSNFATSKARSSATVTNANQSINSAQDNSTKLMLEVARRRELRHLNNEEYMAKQAKGECFMCDEPYSTEHVYMYKELKMLILELEIEGEWL
ncbi:hypothetical protein PIB30_030217 [Stylosanthes scabra]|uniref:Uncharacterized protein n=1 Tax=Stylosanthes scabra TaxID=79078 RepID=A0ABU6UAA5_9FABA|nr:hypothetical protein [Stylosanthes scabra]